MANQLKQIKTLLFLLYLFIHVQCHIVTTKYGSFSGSRGDIVEYFHGIRFAQPPLGSLRLKPPQPIAASSNTFDVSHPINDQCYGILGSLPGELIQGTEDCLKLDIIRPLNTSRTLLPVFVFIHGGDFNSGDKSQDVSSALVVRSIREEKPIIQVSINYRLSFLGFPGGREAQAHNAFNLGLQDQRLALQWIQDNIQHFGGDPKQVTLGGQATGADSVTYQMMAYGGRDDGLFQRVVLQSGAAIGLTPILKPDYAQWQANYDAIVSSTGCSTAAEKSFTCLQNLPIDILVNATFKVFQDTFSIPHHVYAVIVDGVWFQDYPSQLMQEGKFVAVNTLIGHTTNELIDRIPVYADFENDTSILEFTSFFVPYTPQSIVATILEKFPASDYQDIGPPGSGAQWSRVVDVDNYLQSFCPINTAAVQIAGKQKSVWKYRWDALHSGWAKPAYLGVSQGADLPFLYASPSTSAEEILTADFQDSLIAFINYGSVNSSSDGCWPTYTAETRQEMLFSTNSAVPGIVIETDPTTQEKCDLINKHNLDLLR